MIDRAWLVVVVESVDSLFAGVPSRQGIVDGCALIAAAGVRQPRTEIERAIVDALACACNLRFCSAQGRYELNSGIDRVVRYIVDHAENPRVSRAAAAKSAGLAVSWVAHNLKAATGRSFDELVRGKRMEMAQDLLASTDQSVKAIALTVGYQDPSSFVRQFRLQFGLPPCKWRALDAGRRTQDAGRRGSLTSDSSDAISSLRSLHVPTAVM
jgi:AraC-like DNA-binding protein